MIRAITDFKNIHTQGRVIVMGNGPSLGAENLGELALRGVLFGSNRVYLTGVTPQYYCCVNPLVLSQFGDEIANLNTTKFISRSAAKACDWLNQAGDVVWIDTDRRLPGFGNPENEMWEGHTVTFVMLQLAYYMGFVSCALVGLDHDYGERGRYVPNLELPALGTDSSHFHPDYFSGGARWNAPDLKASEVAYSLARAYWERGGRSIVNASKHTRLKVFRVGALPQADTRVAALISAYHCPVDWLVGTLEDLAAQSEAVQAVVVCQDGGDLYQAAVAYNGSLRVTIVTTPDVPTVYRAWNLGAAAANARYLVNANTDDRRAPEALRIMADVLDGRPDIDVVYGDSFITWDVPMTYQAFCDAYALVDLVLGRRENQPGVFMFSAYSREQLLEGCYLGPQPMWRASLHQTHGPFLAEWKSAADYEFWLRVSRDDNMLHIPAVLGVYCARLDGAELRDPVQALDEAEMARRLHQEADGLGIKQAEYGHLAVTLGGRYVFVQPADLLAGLQVEG